MFWCRVNRGKVMSMEGLGLRICLCLPSMQKLDCIADQGPGEQEGDKLL